MTDMPLCWCNPRKEVMPNGNMLIIHNDDEYKTTMNYELAQQLKDAGFPLQFELRDDDTYPNLSELIEACGEIQMRVWSYWDQNNLVWQADNDPFALDVPNMTAAIGKTPEEAVARLWLALHSSKN